jgi:hypothetical protein
MYANTQGWTRFETGLRNVVCRQEINLQKTQLDRTAGSAVSRSLLPDIR